MSEGFVYLFANLAAEDNKAEIFPAEVQRSWLDTRGLTRRYALTDPPPHLCNYVCPPVPCVLHLFQNQDGSALCFKFEPPKSRQPR